MAATSVAKAAAAVTEHAPARPTVEDTIAQRIAKQRDQLALALPRLMDPDRFARVLVTECKANVKLLGCEPTSLMAAVMTAAQCGLEPGPLGHCYLVPFNNNKGTRDKPQWVKEVQFIIGYKGIIDMARRSGKVSSLYAEVVYEGDEFDYQLGLHRDLTHRRSPQAKRDHITHAYAVAHYVDGGFDFIVIDELEIEARRMRSQTGKKNEGPWATDRPSMARKSAVRAFAPFLPLTIEIASALQADERVFDLGQFGDVLDVPIDEEAQDADVVPAGGELPEGTTEATATEVPAT